VLPDAAAQQEHIRACGFTYKLDSVAEGLDVRFVGIEELGVAHSVLLVSEAPEIRLRHGTGPEPIHFENLVAPFMDKSSDHATKIVTRRRIGHIEADIAPRHFVELPLGILGKQVRVIYEERVFVRSRERHEPDCRCQPQLRDFVTHCFHPAWIWPFGVVGREILRRPISPFASLPAIIDHEEVEPEWLQSLRDVFGKFREVFLVAGTVAAIFSHIPGA